MDFKKLHLQPVALFAYNILTAYYIMNDKDMEWNFDLVGGIYREKVGIQATMPAIVSKFGIFQVILNLTMSFLMCLHIFFPTSETQHYLLPGLLCNIYFFVRHFINITVICYDVYALAPGFYASFMITTSSLILMAIHIMLILGTLSYYHNLNLKTSELIDEISLEEFDKLSEYSTGEGEAPGDQKSSLIDIDSKSCDNGDSKLLY